MLWSYRPLGIPNLIKKPMQLWLQKKDSHDVSLSKTIQYFVSFNVLNNLIHQCNGLHWILGECIFGENPNQFVVVNYHSGIFTIFDAGCQLFVYHILILWCCFLQPCVDSHFCIISTLILLDVCFYPHFFINHCVSTSNQFVQFGFGFIIEIMGCDGYNFTKGDGKPRGLARGWIATLGNTWNSMHHVVQATVCSVHTLLSSLS